MMIKYLFKIFLIALIAAVYTEPAYGQRILRNLQEKVQEKVEEKVEKRVDKKLDEAIDKQLDKIEESIESNEPADSPDKAERDRERELRMQRIAKGIGVSGEPVPVADNYTFNHLIEMHIESYDKNGKKESEGQFITHLNPSAKSLAYEVVSGDMGQPGQGIFIIDAENEATIILGEENGNKTAIVYGMGAFFSSVGESCQEPQENETPELFLTNPNVKKTGRTKSIAGYNCEEYIYSDDESESEIWITKDLKMNTQDFFSTLFKTSLYSRGIPWGYMMEATTIDKKSSEKTIMQVKRVNEKSDKRFSLADYQITNLGSFTIPSGVE